MADITASIREIQSAVRGEAVRDALVNALTDLNNDIPVKVTERLEAARQSGAFDGEAGPQGPQGEQGPPGPAGTAANTQYDNTESGLDATDVQSALDELASDFLDGCDQIMQAVTAKGQTPASNSPSDIANAIFLIDSSTQGVDTAKELIEGTLPSRYESDAAQVCEGAFSRYPYIDTIVLPAASALGAFAFSTSSVVSISAPEATTLGRYCFYYCDALRNVDLPKVVIVPEYAFAHSGLRNISLPAAEEIGPCAFEETGLTAVSMPAVKKIGQSAFAECELSELTLPSCEEIGYAAFARCWELTKVTLPAVTTIGNDAFTYSALKHLYLAGNMMVATDRSIGYISGTLTVHVPADLVSAYQSDAVWGQYTIVSL